MGFFFERIPSLEYETRLLMRITLESDYALRIVAALASYKDKMDAKALSSEVSVTPGFTLKILRKLVQGRLVKSYKGVNGGYMLNRAPSDITLKMVIELIDGPLFISRCLEVEEGCSMNPDKTACIYHHIFDTISIDVARKLEGITIQDVLDKTYSLK